MLRAIVIDDEEAGISTVKILAERYASQIRLVATSMDAEEGIALIEDYKPDVVFLDVNMPDINGFELLSRLKYRNFRLVFITAHRDHAIEAIRHKAFDYLLKPIGDDEFGRCVNELGCEGQHAPGTKKTDANVFIEIQVRDGVVFLKQKDIVRLVGARNYTEFYMDNGTRHVASKNLKEFEPRLDPGHFYRCHKSHIVNLQKVQKFVNHDGFFALMCDGSMPDVSKNLKEDFLYRLKSITD